LGTAGDRSEVPIRPVITISRLTGSGGHTIASRLAEYLQAYAPGHCQWTVFDRELMQKVLEDHQLQKSIGDFMPENHKPMLSDLLEELLGAHPSAWALVEETAETILRLAHLGNVILVGRGASVVTRKLVNAFHVRLVGELENRVGRIQQLHHFDHRQALEFIHREDKGRRRYLKEYYDRDIDDPVLYDLMINTDRVQYEEATRLIGDAVIHRFHLDRPVNVGAA